MIPGTTHNCILLYLSQQGNPAQYAALPLFWMLTDTNPINSSFARKGKCRLSLLPTHQAEPRTTQEKVYRRSIHPSGMPVSTYNKKKSRKPVTYSHAESTCGNISPHKTPTTNGTNSRRKGCRCQLSIINPEDGLQVP